MNERTLLYLVFLCQILLASGFLPGRLLASARRILERYPVADYPRLYAATTDAMTDTLRLYRSLNVATGLLGLALLLLDVLAHGALLGWNNGTLVGLYLLVQLVPLIVCVTRSSFPYFSLQRPPAPGSSRSADLRPRRLLDFVSPALLGLAAGLYVGFALLIAWVQQSDPAWFGGWANLASVTALYLVFAAVVRWQIRGKRRDPYMTHEDRLRRIGRSVRIAVLSAIVWTACVGATILLRFWGAPQLIPVALSVVVQATAIVAYREFEVDDVDFEVYRGEPVTSSSG